MIWIQKRFSDSRGAFLRCQSVMFYCCCHSIMPEAKSYIFMWRCGWSSTQPQEPIDTIHYTLQSLLFGQMNEEWLLISYSLVIQIGHHRMKLFLRNFRYNFVPELDILDLPKIDLISRMFTYPIDWVHLTNHCVSPTFNWQISMPSIVFDVRRCVCASFCSCEQCVEQKSFHDTWIKVYWFFLQARWKKWKSPYAHTHTRHWRQLCRSWSHACPCVCDVRVLCENWKRLKMPPRHVADDKLENRWLIAPFRCTNPIVARACVCARATQ